MTTSTNKNYNITMMEMVQRGKGDYKNERRIKKTREWCL